MTPRLILTIIFAYCLTASLYSQSKSAEFKIDTILSKCLSKNQTTVGMSDCLVKSQDLWDKELNKNYKLLVSKLDTVGQRKLKEAQKQWLTYRDKEIHLISEVYGKRDGTMWIIITNDKINQLIRQRAVDLIDYYETLTQE